MDTLLEKATKLVRKNKSTVSLEGEYELLMAWAKDTISSSQYSYAVFGEKIATGNILYRMAKVFQQGVQEGKFVYKK